MNICQAQPFTGQLAMMVGKQHRDWRNLYTGWSWQRIHRIKNIWQDRYKNIWQNYLLYPRVVQLKDERWLLPPPRACVSESQLEEVLTQKSTNTSAWKQLEEEENYFGGGLFGLFIIRKAGKLPPKFRDLSDVSGSGLHRHPWSVSSFINILTEMCWNILVKVKLFDDYVNKYYECSLRLKLNVSK